MKVTVNESPVGVGKTHSAIERMVRYPGRYVFAVERVDAIHEMTTRIMAEAMGSTKLPIIERIYRGNGAIGTVTRQIADLPNRMAAHDHVIALISHEGMMMTDFQGFEGWTLIVDEVPSMFAMHSYRTPTDVAFFETNYTLTPINEDGRWQLVGLTKAGKAVEPSSIAECDGHRYLHHFHRRCRDPRMGPVVNLRSWDEMASGRDWVWWSLFHPAQIASFDHIEMLGNGFTKSVSFTLFDHPDIEWTTISTMGSRPLRHRDVRIVYYSGRPTSLYYLRSPDGQADVGKIARHIAATKRQPLFWSANETVKQAIEPHLGSQDYRLPRQAGTSALMGYHHAAMIYAAKPSSEIDSAITGLGCTAEQWIETNEYETILQFLTRTSVRDVNSTHPVTLHVFNRDQALYLMRFFETQPHITATVEKVDLELSSHARPVRGASKKILTDEEKEARKANHRERNKIAMRKRRAEAKASANHPAL